MAQGKTDNLSWKKKFCYWLAIMSFIFLFFCVVEISLRIFIPQTDPGYSDPYVSFKQIMPLFVLGSDQQKYQTAENRSIFFRPQSFSAVKADNEFRIFCLGGSTVQGRPYSVETSFTSWLELSLRALEPDRQFRVVNCGGISYASYRLVPIMKELLEYQPDMFIVCTGHNEFLEDRTYGKIKRSSGVAVSLHRSLMKLRTYRLAHNAVWKDDSTPDELGAEVQAVLDFEKGLESYERDDKWRRAVVNHFGHNLRVMARISRDAGVPLILVSPPYSLKDSPPFKSQFSVSEMEKQKVLDLWTQSQQVGWDDIYGKIRLLERAVDIEPRHAGLLYLLGMCYDRLGRFDDARKWYLKAKENDICPLRILEPMRSLSSEIAERNDVAFIDIQTEFERVSEDGITGDKQLLDHVHPTIEGHQLIAGFLADKIAEMGFVELPGGWIERRNEMFAEHLSLLNDAYYEKGNARLKRLGEWSRGRIPMAPVQAENQ